ncbi:hypothetical protein SAMD00020551_0892 [Mesobacillus selenatarsenatis SF-1]|uniref:Uncharacterized protein n=1 Tax=Mesobacillus selenatarsenatis (strain DSM 18680 / JCM 14380 / FERM P-15431 / SF-1) TaxID=1321606 RepID=A0A0A8X145_MESS1|nr:hypothetical protein SAMD00020551_0892 [Mesobacillus selenatarsenatis SF-1]
MVTADLPASAAEECLAVMEQIAVLSVEQKPLSLYFAAVLHQEQARKAF